ncbi:MAG TPA: IclR family transcriptional regulator [Actinomycetota bacterium]|nr:IclR family transcriptional regulator [Actinomycetota bacterium]
MIAGRGDDQERERARFQRDVRDGELVRAGRPGQAEDLRRHPPTSGVGVLDRCVAILRAVEEGARSFTDIAEATGLTRSTSHRLIQGLEDHGFLLRIGGLGYALGPRLLALAASASRDLPLRELAHPSLERLARSTGESAQLYVRDGDRRVCIDAAESVSELRTIVEIGASLPLTKGSAGAVFLAWTGEHDRARLVHTAEDPERLERKLITTRRRGWADSVAERAPGVASVSAPISGPDGALLAVVSVSGPAARLGQLRAKRYAPAVLEAAREIEGTLGA